MRRVYHADGTSAIQLPLFTLTKVCTKCGIEKSRDEFNKRGGQCKKCLNEYSHQHYLANREKRLAQCKDYRIANAEHIRVHDRGRNQRPERKARRNELGRNYNRTKKRRAYNREWLHKRRAGNPKWQAYDRNRYHNNPTRHANCQRRNHMRYFDPAFRQYKRVYNAAHPEQAKAQAEKKRLRYATDAEYNRKRKVDGKAWRRANPRRVIEQSRRRQARKLATTVGNVSYTRILQQHGYHCYICGKDIDCTLSGQEPGGLSFDHVIPLAGRNGQKGTHAEDNIRPAHRVCNSRKNVRLLEELTPFDRRGPD